MASTYVKLYEDTFGITWDRRKYEVHHIDGDHDNNDIDNLILLPKKLHRELHKALCLPILNREMSVDRALKEFMGSVLNGWSDWLVGVVFENIESATYACREWAILKQMDYYNFNGEKIKRID